MRTFAPAPGRATANLRLQLGLLSIPVQFFTATEEPKAVERKSFTTDGQPVGHLKVVRGTTTPVDDVVMKVETEKGFIELTDQEIEIVTAGTVCKRNVEIDEFLPLDVIAERFEFTSIYQVRPAKGENSTEDPAAIKAFMLLLDGMRSRDVGALFKVSLRGPARCAILTPDAVVRFIFFDDEVREALPLQRVDVDKREVAMVEQLIEVYTSDEAPSLVNPARELINAYLAEKIAGTAEPLQPVDEPVAQVIDLTAALQASIDAAKQRKAS